ncbi:hypothetical protein [Rhodocista pekingensis]|uniref:Uncharacterized protein n=1 Tax=Rhodocista pekingensis TaxID=201185 RepID=A0ABW2KTN3_9PROT
MSSSVSDLRERLPSPKVWLSGIPIAVAFALMLFDVPAIVPCAAIPVLLAAQIYFAEFQQQRTGDADPVVSRKQAVKSAAITAGLSIPLAVGIYHISHWIA